MNPIRAVSLDAFGTILELEPPAPRLVRELRDGWRIELPESAAERAFTAEIAFYKRHHLQGHDPDSLADLQLRSAGVLLENLPEAARNRLDPAGLLPAMMRSLVFRPYPDVVAALKRFRSSGLRIAVISNWDVSLGEVVDRSGLGRLVDHVVSSAGVGAAKPSPVPFEHGLGLLGLEPSQVVHVGDEPDSDVAGAIAAGIAPVLISRDSGTDPRPETTVPVIETLAGFSPF